MIAFREKVVSVIKRYEKQATAKRVAAASAKSIKLTGKDSNYESQAQDSSKGKGKSKKKRGK
jgi:hypothetical protein